MRPPPPGADRIPTAASRPSPGGHLATAAYLAVIIVGWGGAYPIIKLALRDIGPLTFNALRFAGAAVLIGLCLRLVRARLVPERGERLGLGVIGICQVSVMTGLSTLGLVWIEASRAVLLAYTMPLWATLLGRVLLGEAITRHRLAGTAIGLLGLSLLFNPLTMDWRDPYGLLGSALAIVGTIGWTLGATLYRTRPWRSGFWSQVFWQVAVGAVPLALLAALFEHGRPIHWTPTLAAIFVYGWMVPAAFAYWCWARVLTVMPASTAGQFLMLAPVCGVLMSNLLLGEPLRPVLLASGALILGGALLTLRPPPAAPRPPPVS